MYIVTIYDKGQVLHEEETSSYEEAEEIRHEMLKDFEYITITTSDYNFQ
jgi:hypothetical protein